VLTGHVTMLGFTPVKLQYEPGARRISGFVNDEPFEQFTNNNVADIQFVGLEADTGNPTYFGHANYFRVTRTAEPGQAPALKINSFPTGPVLRWSATNRFVLQHRSSFTPFSTWTNVWPSDRNSTQFFPTNFAAPNGFFRLREL
jgi:hypothetical protein